jgi:hypothetical protein
MEGTHILDLLLEDWGKEEMFKTLIIRANMCVFTSKTTMQQCTISPLFTEAVIESIAGDEVYMQLSHDCSHA